MNAIDPASAGRNSLDGLLHNLERLEAVFASWEETPRGVAEAYRRAIEALHGEALRRLVRALKAASTQSLTGLPGARLLIGGQPAFQVEYEDAVTGSCQGRLQPNLRGLTLCHSHGPPGMRPASSGT